MRLGEVLSVRAAQGLGNKSIANIITFLSKSTKNKSSQ